MISIEEFGKKLEFKFKSINIIFKYHPVTLKKYKNKEDLITILDTLGALGENMGILIAKSNADEGGEFLIKRMNL